VRNQTREIERMVKRIRQQSPGEIHVCYEAGLCGFVLQRRLKKLGGGPVGSGGEAIAPALPASARTGQVGARGHHRGGAGTGRFRLGAAPSAGGRDDACASLTRARRPDEGRVLSRGSGPPGGGVFSEEKPRE